MERIEVILAEKAMAGNADAFCELYKEYKDRLYRYAYYKLGDPSAAEDAVSDCVLAAWKDIARLRSGDAFSAWIFRILHNICVTRVRQEIKARAGIADMYQDSLGIQNARSPETAVELAEALASLADEEREIVILSVVSGLTSGEISAITGLTAGAVRSKLSRSLAKMRVFLTQPAQ